MLSDFQTLVTNLVGDEGGNLAAGAKDQAIALAVTRYSTDRPRVLVADIALPGGHFFNLPPAWEPGLSIVKQIEAPPGQVPPSLLSPGCWQLYQDLDATRILLDSAQPNGATIRLHFTVSHTLTALADTIPLRDREPVCAWAAGILLDQLATLYAGNRQPTIAADTVDWQSKSRDFASRAKAMRQNYLDQLGLDTKRNVAAGAVVAAPLPTSHGGRPLLLGRHR